MRVVTGDRVDLFLVALHLGQRGQAAEDHHVVDGCRVVVRGVRIARQVLHVHVEQRRAAQALRGGLHVGQVAHEVGAVEVDPDKAVVRRALGRRIDKAQAAGGEFDDVHGRRALWVKLAAGA